MSPIYESALAAWKAKPSSTAYISTTDTAKLIRALLKRKFPNTVFSVKSSKYSGGSSIRVRWTDGPTAALVSAYVDPFAGAGFDGMIDLKYYKDAWLYPDGSATYGRTSGTTGSGGVYSAEAPDPAADGAIPVSFSADYVFCERSYSVASLERALAAYAAKFGWEAAEGVEVIESEYGAYMGGSNYEAAREVRNMANRRMLPVAMPKIAEAA